MKKSQLRRFVKEELKGYSKYLDKPTQGLTQDTLEKILTRIAKSGYEEEDTNESTINPVDRITLDIPLFIRLLEYAKEDAQTDMDLHDVAERAIKLGSVGGVALSMDDYNALVQGEEVEEGKKKGVDGKACWKGYRYAGTKDGKDNCVKVKK